MGGNATFPICLACDADALKAAVYCLDHNTRPHADFNAVLVDRRAAPGYDSRRRGDQNEAAQFHDGYRRRSDQLAACRPRAAEGDAGDRLTRSSGFDPEGTDDVVDRQFLPKISDGGASVQQDRSSPKVTFHRRRRKPVGAQTLLDRSADQSVTSENSSAERIPAHGARIAAS
jgi:hypothetical protein